MRALVLGSVLVLAACEPSPRPVAVEPSDAARIAAVEIGAVRFAITMSDGARCVVERPKELTGGWSGTTDNCGYALPYEVVYNLRSEAADRFKVEQDFGVLGADGAVKPRVEIFVVDVDGTRRQFLAPLPESATIRAAETL